MFKRHLLYLLLIPFCFPATGSAQSASTSAELDAQAKSYAQHRENSLLAEYPSRNIGPVVQGGRITDLEVDPRNSKRFFVGYASGGLFLTEDNGHHFVPVFDNQAALGVGDLALSRANPDVIWVGTGENNSSRSSYAGAGVFRSEDGGKSWTHCGLSGTQHIGRIETHPKNPDIAWVAAIGPLYTKSEERGLYKTTDGGKSWKKTLYVDDNSGIIDLVINPANPNELLAASWDRNRQAWEFQEGGKGSAIWRSDDGGDSWKKVENGFPTGTDVGRIGLSWSESKPNTVFAILDNQAEMEKPKDELSAEENLYRSLRNMSKEKFLSIPDSALNKMIEGKGYPSKYNAETVKESIKNGEYTVFDLANYFGDANEALFNTRVTGAEIYRSENAGKDWKKVNSTDLEGMFYTYGYYFGQIRVDPTNAERIYIFGVPFLRSEDGGKTFSRLDTFRVHVDHHALWVDPADPEHLLLGNDGGLYQSYDGGGHFLHLNNLPVGQFYTVNVDMEQPYNVYGGLQDNGTVVGSSRSVPNRTDFWEHIWGGDGMFVGPDPRNADEVLVGFQFGHYWLLDRESNNIRKITPRHDIGEAKLRFNWRTPVIRSPHHPDLIYFGSQKLHRSLNVGESWETLSPDLTTNREQGNVPYSTLTTIEESPLKFGLIWVGTDDGNVQVTNNHGSSWWNCQGPWSKGLWVSRVFASPHDEKTAFVSLNGYRQDDFHTHIYKTTNMGKNWESIQGNLPEDVVNCIIQDPEVPELLYAGLDHGTFVSLDGGENWNLLGSIPNVASYDLLVHPRDGELVVATHGRSIYITSVLPLREMAQNTAPFMLFEPSSISFDKKWGEKPQPWSQPNLPELKIEYFVKEARKNMTIEVADEKGKVLVDWKVEGEKGFHRSEWDLKDQSGNYIQPGSYKIILKKGKTEVEVPFELMED